MSTVLLCYLLITGSPGHGYSYCDAIDNEPQTLGIGRHLEYHRRLYYGYYQRQPYDYRRQFDYTWQTGSAQLSWPIPPLRPAPCERRVITIAAP
jgi:hypothetical protein